METIPKYREIMDYIQEQIQNHVYQQNAKLPTEQELSEQFDVSRPTVVKALDRLRDMGAGQRHLCQRRLYSRHPAGLQHHFRRPPLCPIPGYGASRRNEHLKRN